MRRYSYLFLAAMLVLLGLSHMATLLLSVLFSTFALRKLEFGRSKLPAVGLFVLLVAGFSYGAVHFTKEALQSLPRIVETSIPMILDYAHKQGVELPFYDYESLRAVLISGVKDQLYHVGKFARVASREIALLLIGFVVAISFFLSPKFEQGRPTVTGSHNFYSRFCQELAARFAALYQSFAVVIGAQLIISAINTTFTAIFVVWTHLPHALIIIVTTFICGLLPIIGNLISNSIIVLIAFTVSPQMALLSLIFLVTIHKLEYLLNSKIIGDRIKNPVWLTMLALIVGERIMGIPGMILAPVVLYYLKLEASQIAVPAPELEPELAANKD